MDMRYPKTRPPWIVLLTLLLGHGEAVAQTAGYRLLADQVLVRSRTDWQNWEFAPGTLQISARGDVRPRRLERNKNAATEIVELLRLDPPEALKNREPASITLDDAIEAGSNPNDVSAVLDGRMDTYWEPAPPREGVDLASQWWFVVDLGELTFVRKIVLRFGEEEEEQGDPFLLFDVLVSDGTLPRGSTDESLLRFKTVLRTLVANKSQRSFEIDFESVPEVEGELARVVKVVVTGSDLDRGREVAKAVYDGLSAADRGAIDYLKLQPDGSQTQVDESVYALLDAERQGDIRHFRRERPRLAELEVWKEGDNVMRGVLNRGGSATSTGTSIATGFVVDGSIDTFSFLEFVRLDMELLFDLGAHFWIDAHRLIFNNTKSASSSSFPSYQIDFSDGSLAPDGTLKWLNAVEREQTPTGGVNVEGNSFESVKARFFRTRWLDTGGASNLAEIQLFGQGYQPEVVLESPMIVLGASRNLLSVDWQADEPEGTQLLIQTRTGNETEDIFRYFDRDGEEVTKQFYHEKLRSFTRGDSIPAQIPGSDWSGWSQPYADPTGSAVTSPSPRRFLQVRATLLSDAPDTSAALSLLRLRFGGPVAQQLVGEIDPPQVDSLGVETAFSLYFRPSFERSDHGFDQLLLVAPGDIGLTFDGLYSGVEDDFAVDPDLDRLRVDTASLIQTAPDSLYLEFSPVTPTVGAARILRLDFRTILFSSGTALQLALQHSLEGPGVWQRVDGGDAVSFVDGNTTTVVGSLTDNRLIVEAEARPKVVTPNGDGVNDATVFAFKILRIDEDSPVQATIYDLGGHRLRRLEEQRPRSAGQYAMSWDGTDDAGTLVPPGLYVVHLSVGTASEGAGLTSEEAMLSVGVAY